MNFMKFMPIQNTDILKIYFQNPKTIRGMQRGLYHPEPRVPLWVLVTPPLARTPFTAWSSDPTHMGETAEWSIWPRNYCIPLDLCAYLATFFVSEHTGMGRVHLMHLLCTLNVCTYFIATVQIVRAFDFFAYSALYDRCTVGLIYIACMRYEHSVYIGNIYVLHVGI